MITALVASLAIAFTCLGAFLALATRAQDGEE
jgi:hypothetical protein